MGKRPVECDERTTTVDNAAGNLAYKVMTWFLVIDLGVRGMAPQWTVWNGFPVDIFVIIMAGGLAWTWQAWRNQVISRNRLRQMISAAIVAAVVSALLAGARVWLSH